MKNEKVIFLYLNQTIKQTKTQQFKPEIFIKNINKMVSLFSLQKHST